MNASAPFVTIAAIKKDPGPIPELKPPQDFIPIDLPDKAILSGALIFAFIVLILGRVFRRPRPVTVLPPDHPASAARRALSELTPNTPTPVVAASASRAIRDYVRTAFALGDEEMTTTEFCARFALHPLADANSEAELNRFLHDCEQAQFAPSGFISSPDLADRARAMVDFLEQQRTSAMAHPASPSLS